MPSPGDVFFDEEFKFHDGEVGRKLLKTTSRGNSYKLPIPLGCQCPKPLYFVTPAEKVFTNENGFTKPTWIQLDRLHYILRTRMDTDSTSRIITPIGTLKPLIFTKILQCALESEDMTSAERDMLQSTLNSLTK